MDMIDILGGMLGRKKGGGGKGPDILRDIFGRGKRTQPELEANSAPGSTGESQLDRAARDLEDLLNVAQDREATRGPGRSPAPQSPPLAPPHRQPADSGRPVDSPYSRDRGSRSAPMPPAGGPSQNDQAQVLVSAMVNAAKADGRLSSDEQQSILQQFGGEGAEVVRFLRDEFAKPLDVREFAWSVPIGMEHQVYAMPLLAIQVDSRAESEYLDDLAHGLRLPAEAREQLQKRYSRPAD